MLMLLYKAQEDLSSTQSSGDLYSRRTQSNGNRLRKDYLNDYSERQFIFPYQNKGPFQAL